jgi:thiosulfate dehydrogenase (quinone) large subunit
MQGAAAAVRSMPPCLALSKTGGQVDPAESLGDYNVMFYSIVESIKYIGHFFPLLCLRLYLGVYFVDQAWSRYSGNFLDQPRLAETIRDWSSGSPAPEWYKDLLDQWLLPHWQLAAYCVVYFQFVVGISLILGFLVRPMALLGAFLALNFVFWSSAEVSELHRLQVVVFFVLAWMSAGRCFGMDYYFYKRHRGVWW